MQNAIHALPLRRRMLLQDDAWYYAIYFEGNRQVKYENLGILCWSYGTHENSQVFIGKSLYVWGASIKFKKCAFFKLEFEDFDPLPDDVSDCSSDDGTCVSEQTLASFELPIKEDFKVGQFSTAMCNVDNTYIFMSYCFKIPTWKP